MLKKLFRVLWTIVGMLVGYGVSLLFTDEDMLGRFLGLDSLQNWTVTVILIILFGLIFYYLFEFRNYAPQEWSRVIEVS